MPSAGARALFSAPRSRLATRPRLRSSLLPACGHIERRAFRSSSRALHGRPDDENTPDRTATETSATKPDVPNTEKAESRGDDGPAPDAVPAPAPAPAAEGQKETARAAGYGSARARAVRHKVEEEIPANKVPPWFPDEYISLYESRPPIRKGNELMPLAEEDQRSLVEFLDFSFVRFRRSMELSYHASAKWKENYYHKRTHAHWLIARAPRESAEQPVEKTTQAIRDFTALERSGAEVCSAACHQVLALAYNHGGPPDSLSKMRELCRLAEPGHTLLAPLGKSRLDQITPDALRWLTSVRFDEGPDAGRLYASSIASRRGREYTACLEIVATLKAEMDAESARGNQPRDPRRPVTVVSIVGCLGSRFAQSVVNGMASELEADVLHLDAHTISLLLAHYVGQGPQLGRGSISSLGYGAAEMNGRLVVARESDAADQMMPTITVSLQPRFRSMVSKKMSYASPDDRWDDLKLNKAVTRLLDMVKAERALSTAASAYGQRPIIVHLHNYVEIGTLNHAIIQKLRNAVDVLRSKGQQVVLLGSSSSDGRATDVFRTQLAELGNDEGHVIPFSVNPVGDKPGPEETENVRENMINIMSTVDALVGKPYGHSVIDNWPVFVWQTGRYSWLSDACRKAMWQGVYDASWVKRMATMILGLRSNSDEKRSISDEISCAFDLLTRSDKEAAELHPGSHAPHYLVPPGSYTAQPSPGSEEWSFGPSTATSSSSSSQQGYDQYEKKLLPGLVDPKDLHTTFDDVILAPDAKESIISLTTLSILRPEAFSYGVLKAERIPGCLLYGPPGTGKTLLAKAVAKQSGARMLEVSAASINDMYVGQSEKNVRAVFSLARKLSPAVIFLDEADALLSARGSRLGRSSHRETMTQFLREWDGMQDMGSFIMVATNRPFDLDEAVLRRLPRRILVDLPLRPQREQILRKLLRDEELDAAVDLADLAARTELYSGSDLKNVCVAAAMEAVRDENRLQAAHEGPEPFVFPAHRVLTPAHFARGLRDIGASISEDMDSLKAIRNFDERFGDAGRRRKGPRHMGFEAGPVAADTTEGARIRKAVEPLPA